jgi:hypothetical protein
MRDIAQEAEDFGGRHTLLAKGANQGGHDRFNRRMPREGLYLLCRHALI